MGSHPLCHKVLLPQLKMIVIILMALLTCGGGQQIPPPDGNTLILRNVIDTLGSLSQQLKEFQVTVEAKFEEIQEKISAIDESQKSGFRNMEDQETTLVAKIEGHEQRMEAKLDEIQSKLTEMEEIQKADRRCVMDNKIYNQGDVITKNYQSLVCGERSWLPNPEDVDECRDVEAFLCGDNEECFNTADGYNCQCQEGYHREDNTCQDVNECLDNDAFQCGQYEDCVNTQGHYTCQCQEGYHREDNTCQACLSPSLYLEELGCISSTDHYQSWDESKTICEQEDKRLLEGIKYKHIQPLANYFYPIMGGNHNFWIGMQHSRWITSGEEVSDEDDLWRSGQPDKGNSVCGVLYVNPNNSPGLLDAHCSGGRYALCQSLPSY